MLTYADDGCLLMAVVPILGVWPTFGKDVQQLFDLAEILIPWHDRAKTGSRREIMRSFGIRQLGMGTNRNSVLLKIYARPEYELFKRVAALYFSKQSLLEQYVAPQNSRARAEMRDVKVANSCCAIPGAEATLFALACSVTQGYFPDLQHDSPKAGTLECILFFR